MGLIMGAVLAYTKREDKTSSSIISTASLPAVKMEQRVQTLGDANRALILATEEASLIQAMCAVVTGTGGYPVAWVALCDRRDPRFGRPVAWSGEGVTDFRPAWSARQGPWWGSGLLDEDVLSDLPFLFPLTVAHPALEPWRDAALRHGYTVVAVMPLMIRGQLLGSLVVPGFGIAGLGDGDVTLLGEVAGLLSYGIAALRDRAAHESGLLKRREVIEATVTALANTLEESDPYTAGHQRRTADLAVAIARQMGLAEQTVYGIRLASLIHDVGKIAAPAEILNRPGKLSSAQFEIIKTHCKVGFDIVKGIDFSIDFSWPVAQTILQHHERLDGSGYPAGLAGGQILLEARIVAVADVVEAITSFRPYRPALGIDVALDEIGSGRGRHYDPAVVDACLAAVHGGALGFA